MSRWKVAATAVALVACSGEPLGPRPGDGPALASTAEIGPLARPEPIDPDFAIHLEPTAAGGDGILIYDIQNGFVYDGPAQAGQLLLNVDERTIRDASDTEVLCRFDGAQLFDAGGNLIYLLARDDVYEADGRTRKYRIKRNEIYEMRPGRTPLATTTEDLSRMSDWRKLLVAVLLSARCGAPSLPGR